jgi:hypothetical protein
MKTRGLFLSVSLLIILIVILAGCVTGKKTIMEKTDILTTRSGTWINTDYENKGLAGKYIIKPDGSYEVYSKITSSVAKVTGELIEIEAWIDSKGNIWYKSTGKESWAPTSTFYELGKIDSSKSVWEHVSSRGDYPTELDPNDYRYTYRIYYRQ